MIYTSTMNYYSTNGNHDRIDVNITSLLFSCLAPKWYSTLAYNSKQITWKEYMTDYYDTLDERRAYGLNRMSRCLGEIAFRALINDITLVCEYEDHTHCYSHILAEWLQKLLNQYFMLVNEGKRKIVYAGRRVIV